MHLQPSGTNIFENGLPFVIEMRLNLWAYLHCNSLEFRKGQKVDDTSFWKRLFIQNRSMEYAMNGKLVYQ